MIQRLRLGLALLATMLVSATSACATSDPTQAVVVNAFTDDYTVLKVWYRSELFIETVPKGAESSEHRVTTGSEYAYAIVTKGYDSEAGVPTGPLVVVRTTKPLPVARGDTVRITLSEATTVAECFGSPRLGQAEYERIAQRIFPAETVPDFDPTKCGALPPGDGGSDATSGDAPGD